MCTAVVQVVFTEDMEADPVKTLAEVLDFLGLDMLDPLGEKVRQCHQ